MANERVGTEKGRKCIENHGEKIRNGEEMKTRKTVTDAINWYIDSFVLVYEEL